MAEGRATIPPSNSRRTRRKSRRYSAYLCANVGLQRHLQLKLYIVIRLIDEGCHISPKLDSGTCWSDTFLGV